MCSENKIFGTFKKNNSWQIPTESDKPKDNRENNGLNLAYLINQKLDILRQKRALTKG